MKHIFAGWISKWKDFTARRKNADGNRSPNFAALTVALTLFLAALFCAQSLWIPFSRIGNLYVRSVGLAAADAFAVFASSTGLDTVVPRLRESFLQAAGLTENLAWDARYFNRRQSAVSASPSAAETATAGGTSSAAAAAGASPETASSGAAVPDTVQVRRGRVSPRAVHSAENPLRVYVFGDSQVYSLGIGLSRLAGKDSAIAVDYLPVHSSGFIRQDYFSWNQKLADTFAETAYDAGVVMMGMNDYQNFWTDEGVVAVKETAFWEEEYKKKCRSVLDTALLYLPRVYWLGMPLVKNSTYAGHLAYIGRIQQEVAAEYSPDVLAYIPLQDAVPGAGKPYTDTLVTGSGKRLKVMSDDGSHFTVEGGQLAMRPLFDRLCADFPFARVPSAHLPE